MAEHMKEANLNQWVLQKVAPFKTLKSVKHIMLF